MVLRVGNTAVILTVRATTVILTVRDTTVILEVARGQRPSQAARNAMQLTEPTCHQNLNAKQAGSSDQGISPSAPWVTFLLLCTSKAQQPPCLANSFQLLQLFIGLVCLVSKLAHPLFNFVFYHLCASDVFPHLAICQHLDVALQCIHDVRHLGHQASVIGLPDFLHIATCISQQPLTCCLCICHCRLHTLPSKLGSRLGLHDFHSACLGFGAWP